MAGATSTMPPSSSTSHPLNHTMSMHSTVIVRGSHQFTVAGYSLQKGGGIGHCIRSGSFEVGEYNWVIKFCPAGDTKESEGYVSISLEMKTTAMHKVTAKFNIRIDGATGNSSYLHSSDKWVDFTTLFKSWGFTKFMKIETVESEYLINDCLTMHCAVEVVKELQVTGATWSCFITVPPPGICRHMEQLLESKHGSDVTFKVEQSDYDAHRAVLAARSPVFSAQFFGPMADGGAAAGGSRQFVRIDDMKPAVFEAVLHFVYTDTLPPVEDKCFQESDSASHQWLRDAAAGCSREGFREMVGEWLAAADRFDLERMRLMCENALCETINVANAAVTLRLAERHNCSQLKAFCMEYVASPGVLAAVVATDGFRELKASACPSLLAEVLEKLGSCS